MSPSSAWYLVITPLYLARMSTVTLSVSILAIMSSALTAVPTSTIIKKFNEITGDKGFDNSLGDGVAHGGDLLSGCRELDKRDCLLTAKDLYAVRKSVLEV